MVNVRRVTLRATRPSEEQLNAIILCRHTDRVRKIALVLAELEGLPEESWFVVELAALLHDLDDHKYVTVDHLHESAKARRASLDLLYRAHSVLSVCRDTGSTGKQWRGIRSSPPYSSKGA